MEKMKRILVCLAALISCGIASAEVFINEVQSSNDKTCTDERGEAPDWIELYNSGESAVKLGGWVLTDKEKKPEKWWYFPKGTSIEPKGYLMVYADSTGVAGPVDGGDAEEDAPAYEEPLGEIKFSQKRGIYGEPFELTLTYKDAPDGTSVKIYYTLDREEPTTESTLYEVPITIEDGDTLEFLAEEADETDPTVDDDKIKTAIKDAIDPADPDDEGDVERYNKAVTKVEAIKDMVEASSDLSDWKNNKLEVKAEFVPGEEGEAGKVTITPTKQTDKAFMRVVIPKAPGAK